MEQDIVPAGEQLGVFACATSPSAVRGLSLNFLFLDEFAHLGGKLAEEFISSVFPTISSSAKTSKLVIVSTPKGMNHYYKMWTEAKDNTNGFKAFVESHWSEHPKRNRQWAAARTGIAGTPEATTKRSSAASSVRARRSSTARSSVTIPT
jgi:hypothetical protein